jgi:regulator of ribonuclease activity A
VSVPTDPTAPVAAPIDPTATWTSTADLIDAHPHALVSCCLQLHDFGGRRRFAGQIRTVRSPGDTVLVKKVLAEPGAGAVLVIDGDGSTWSALMGDRTALMAAGNGWTGIVINGVVRDVDALAAVDIGIKALGANPRKPAQQGSGEIDVPVSFGRMTFWPGAPLWADSDGVVSTSRPPSENSPITPLRSADA